MERTFTELLTPKMGIYKILPTAFGGHCYYTRRCVRGEQYGDNFFDRIEKGILLPQQATINQGAFTIIRNIYDRCWLMEVLAIGANVGKPCSKGHMYRFKRARWIEPVVAVGDILLFDHQEVNIGIQPSPFAECDRFVEESVPIAIWKEEVSNVR